MNCQGSFTGMTYQEHHHAVVFWSGVGRQQSGTGKTKLRDLIPTGVPQRSKEKERTFTQTCQPTFA